MQDNRPNNTKCLCHIEKICQACDPDPCNYGRPSLLKTEVACKDSDSHTQCRCCKCIKCPVSVIKRLCQLALRNGDKPEVAKERYSVFEGGRTLNFDKKAHLDGRGDFIYKRKPKSPETSSDEIKPKGQKISSKSGAGAKTRSPQRRRVTSSISETDLALKSPKKKKIKGGRASLDYPKSASDSGPNEQTRAQKIRKRVRDTEVESEPYSRKGRKSRLTKQESELSYTKRKSGKGSNRRGSRRRDEDYQDDETESDVPRGKAMRSGRDKQRGSRKTYSETDKEAEMKTDKRKTRAESMYDGTETIKKGRASRRGMRDNYSDEEAEKPYKKRGGSADRESERHAKKGRRMSKTYDDEYEDDRKYPHSKGKKLKKHDIDIHKSKLPDDITSWSSEDKEHTKKKGKGRPDDGVGRSSKGRTHKIPRSGKPRSDDDLRFSPSTSFDSLTGKRKKPTKKKPVRPSSEDEDDRHHRKPVKPKDPPLWSADSFEKKLKKRKKGVEKRKILEKVPRDLLIPEDSKESPRGSEDKSTIQVPRRKGGRRIPGHRPSMDEFRTMKKLKCLPVMPTRFDTGAVSDWMRLRLEVSDRKRLTELCKRSENKLRPECKEFHQDSCVPNPSFDNMPQKSHSAQVNNACHALNPLSYCFI